MITTYIPYEGIASDDTLIAIYERIVTDPRVLGPSISATSGEIRVTTTVDAHTPGDAEAIARAALTKAAAGFTSDTA